MIKANNQYIPLVLRMRFLLLRYKLEQRNLCDIWSSKLHITQ